MFSAPNAPRYHGYDSETFKMRDFIDRPFLLKRIELRISVEARRRFGNNPAGAASTNSWDEEIYNKKDIDNYVFFVYRQRRLSKNKDSFDDRTTSKRYLIASASLCYYNSGSFGGAWSDGYYTDPSSNWQDPANVAIWNGIARPDDAVDFFGQSLTKISSSNAILHNPQYVKDWGQQRTIGAESTLYDRQDINLKMLPAVVPPCSVAPSLIPVTRSLSFGGAAAVRFQRREGGTSSPPQYCYYYMTSGTRANPSLNRPAPFLTLASHQWFGGTRPPTVVSFSNGYYYGFSVNIPDSYDAIFSPAELAGRGAVAIPGQVDAIAAISPTYVSSSYSEILNLDIDSRTVFSAIRGPTQSHGISMLPAFFVSGSSEQLGVKVGDLKYQQPIDPQAVNSPIPAGNTSTARFYGRKSFNSADPNDWTVEHGKRYMGYYGWRFISSFQVGDMTERQIYSPMLLEPEDELILGLDAGTFGPPDLSQDDLVADGLGPTTGSGHGVGYEPAGVKKSYKDTFLKEDYSAVMVGSSLRIQTGDAQLVLIGEFLQNGQPVNQSRDVPISSNVSTFYGEEEIYDVNLLYNADLMSGSMLTRIFSGSEGPDGLIRGNTNPSLARRFFYDAGARKSY
jgi:hypothetical protein